MTVKLPLPFRTSRHFGGGNGLLAEPCVALDVVGIDLGDDLHHAWRRRILSVAHNLGWPAPTFASINDGPVITLMFTAPSNQLGTACEANEWALCAAVVERDPGHWSGLRESLRAAVSATAAGHPDRPCGEAEIDEPAAMERLVRLGAAEARASGRC